MIISRPRLPVCCLPEAFSLICEASRTIDSPAALVTGAVGIARHSMFMANVFAANSMLHRYADKIKSGFKGSSTQVRLAHLHEYLFEKKGFGEASSPDEPGYYFLPAVLGTCQGAPSILSLIYAEVATRLGFKAECLHTPRLFVVSVFDGKETILISPKDHGRIVTRDEIMTELRETYGEEFEYRSSFFEPINNKQWLTSILRQLRQFYMSLGTSDGYREVAAILEMEIALWPDHIYLWRDIGLIYAQCGSFQSLAIEWLMHFLEIEPNHEQKEELHDLIKVLRKK